MAILFILRMFLYTHQVLQWQRYHYEISTSAFTLKSEKVSVAVQKMSLNHNNFSLGEAKRMQNMIACSAMVENGKGTETYQFD